LSASKAKRSILPLLSTPSSAILPYLRLFPVKSIEYSERSDFKPNEKYILDPSVYPYYGCVAVEHNTTHVWTTYRYQMSKGGAPDRLLKTRTLKTSLDEWAQVVENGRFSTEEEWSYQKVVTNVGLMSRFEPLFFMSKSPQASFSSLAELW
jgi:hypothetical protein